MDATSPAAPTPAGLVAAFVPWPARRVVFLRSALPLVSEDAPTSWVDVAYEGAWLGHSMGAFEFTRERFEQAVRNFGAKANPTKLDFDHETEFAMPGAATPARGWVHELEVRDDEDGVAHLWALVEFGAEAVEINRSGGYRFCSGVFDFEATDRMTGESIGLELRSLALTDDPFIDGQEPIRLSRRGAAAEEITMPGKKRALGAAQEKLASVFALLNVDMSTLEESDFWGAAYDAICALVDAARQEKVVGDGGGAAEEPTPAPQLARLSRGDFLALSGETDKLGALFSLLSVDEAALSDVEKANPWGVVFERIKGLAGAQAAPSTGTETTPPPVAASNEGEPDEVALQTTEEINMLAEQLMQALGVDAEGLQALLEKLQADTAAGENEGGEGGPTGAPAPALSARMRAQDETIRALTARLDGAEGQLREYREHEADEAVEQLVKGGRLLETGRKTFRELFLSNRKLYDEAVLGLPQVVPVKPHALSATPPTQEEPAIDEDDEEVKSLRLSLSRTSLTQEQQDAAVRKHIARRKGPETRV